MQILLVTWNYPPKVGGIEMLLSNLVEKLRGDHSVDVIAPGDKNSFIHKELQTYRTRSRNLLFFLIEAIFIGFSLLRNNKYDFILAGSPLVSFVVYLLGLRKKCPIVVNVYGLDLIFKNIIYQTMIRKTLPKFDAVVAISRATRNLALQTGVDQNKIIIVHPGIT